MERETLLKLIELMDTDYKKSCFKKSDQYLKAEEKLLKTATAQELLTIMDSGESFDFKMYFNAFLKRKDGQALIDIVGKNIDLNDKDIADISKVLIEIGKAKYIYKFVITIPDWLNRLLYKDTLPSLMAALSKSKEADTLIEAYKNYKIRQFDGANNKIFNRILEVASVNQLIGFVNENFENVNFPSNKNTGYLSSDNIQCIIDTICDIATPFELREAISYMRSKLTKNQKEQIVETQVEKTTKEEDAIYLAQVYVDIALESGIRYDILKKIEELDVKEAKQYILVYTTPEDYERKIIEPTYLTAEQKGIEEILSSLEETK